MKDKVVTIKESEFKEIASKILTEGTLKDLVDKQPMLMFMAIPIIGELTKVLFEKSITCENTSKNEVESDDEGNCKVYVRIYDGGKGAHGADGSIGYITKKKSSNGCLDTDLGFNVNCGGSIWRVGNDAIVKILGVK